MTKLERQVRDFLAGRADMKNLMDAIKWVIYFKYRYEERAKPLIRSLCREEEGIMRAEKALSKVDRDMLKAAREMAKIKNRMDLATNRKMYFQEMEAETMPRGMAKGIAQGLAEGKAEAGLEIARKMKAAGIAAEQIHSITGLSSGVIEKL